MERPNQVWAADICYLPMARGFLYLVAVMDWYSRKVLAWRLSNEPPRVSRRVICLSQAAMAGSSSWLK